MDKISIACGPTGGDCTSEYFITLREEMTVGEFINHWLATRDGEWGYFGINDGHSIFGDPNCEYKHGKIENAGLLKEYLNKKILKVSGSGGWSRSDFLFTVEDDKKQDGGTEMTMEIRKEVAQKIWDICKISPEHKDAVIDLIGYCQFDNIIKLSNGPFPIDFLMKNLDNAGINYELHASWADGGYRRLVIRYKSGNIRFIIDEYPDGFTKGSVKFFRHNFDESVSEEDILDHIRTENGISMRWGVAFQYIFSDWWSENDPSMNAKEGK